MKNILFIANECEKGGATKSMLKLIYLLSNDNVNIKVLTPIQDGKVKNFCNKNKIECFYVKYKKVSVSLNPNEILKNIFKVMLIPYLYIISLIINHLAVIKISKIINLSNIDYIHTNIVRDEIGLLLKRKYNIKHIMHLREYGKEDFNCFFFRKNYYDFLNQNVDSFIAISNSIKESYIVKGLDEKKITVIYNGVDLIQNQKKEYSLKDNKINIVMVGALSETKGQIQVIKALYNLKIKYGDFFNLYLFGEGSKTYIRKLKKYILNNELNSNIFFMGQCEKVTEEIWKYDLAVMASKSEAFGRVTIEYMLSKIPIIASDTGANSEIIIDKMGGLLYKYNDIDDLSKKIYEFFINKELRKEFADYSYRYAIKKFLATINEKEVKKIYEVNRNEES